MSSSRHSEYDHTSEEWEAQRDLFTHYYAVEDKPLREVKEIMENQYGFRATERQYKRRIALWNLDKNIKDSDMKVMLRVQLQRRNQEGKETAFYLHGRPVPHQKLERYLRRKALSEADIMSWNMPLPSYITCHTPTYETAPQMGESSRSGAAGQYGSYSTSQYDASSAYATTSSSSYYPTYYSSY
ncbi:hypothetical protein OIDMADRAFT_145279 [Oidiodendron maius Zn]|uniref:Clr5 domain-containing protein n=1 Tax=Oidiodendron maius (strain Zn) TaxID=913774 RepID=A0A0C3HD93_OIDMZ|nr:hypothetical protein OIDMADRAFT_145279 [Oidiodendron maius Zn]